VVSFDAVHARTKHSEWAADPHWSDVPALAIRDVAANGLLVFSAHADDETLGVGALIAEASDLALPVHIVVATDGGAERRTELARALAILHTGATVTYLDFPDSRLKFHEDALRRRIDEILDAHGVGRETGEEPSVISVWSGDRHGDHRTLGRALQRAMAVRARSSWQFPIWLWQWGVADDVPWQAARRIAVSTSSRERKRRAIEEFSSQLIAVRGPEGVLSEEFLEHARCGEEVLFASAGNTALGSAALGSAALGSAALGSAALGSDWPETGSAESEPAADAAADHFELLHSASSDPWSVRTRWYERRKRAITLAVLPRERYRRALDVGCSVGELAAEAAGRCDELLAIDSSAQAVSIAAERLRDSGNASAAQLSVPDEWPEGTFDLILVSELAYYLQPVRWSKAIRLIHSSLSDDGTVVLCHWSGHADDFAQSASAVHALFWASTDLLRTTTHRDSEFLLDVYQRPRSGRTP
jgi:LmbE family N-acetylglucosaminyl deacetylase/SAM-dependent methyltransferase